MPSKLYVGNLAFGVSKSDLEELFSKAGQVQSVAVITHKFSGQSRGLRLLRNGRCGGRFQGNTAIQRY